MSILSKISHHHKDEKQAVEDAPTAQKVRVSGERRVLNFGKLIREEIPDNPEQHRALAKLHDFRVAFEEAVNTIEESD